MSAVVMQTRYRSRADDGVRTVGTAGVASSRAGCHANDRHVSHFHSLAWPIVQISTAAHAFYTTHKYGPAYSKRRSGASRFHPGLHTTGPASLGKTMQAVYYRDSSHHTIRLRKYDGCSLPTARAVRSRGTRPGREPRVRSGRRRAVSANRDTSTRTGLRLPQSVPAHRRPAQLVSGS